MILKKYMKLSILIFLLVMVAFLLFIDDEEPLFLVASEESKEEESNEGSLLEDKIDEIINDDLLDGGITGISIRNANTGELLFSRLGNTRLHPASNMKLLTGAAALETLGSDYQFTTEVWTDGSVKEKVLQGNVYLKGKGDPTLMKKDLDQFAADIIAHGIQKIKGDVIGDDNWYDAIRLSQDLNWSDEPFHTGAQVSALTLSPNKDYDAGTIIVEVIPSAKEGGKAEVRIIPETDYVTIVNSTEMVAETDEKDISIDREHGSNTIIVEGKMPINGTKSRSWASVWEPSGYAVDVFKKSLEEYGLTFVGNSELKTGATPENATLLASRKSMPLGELLIPFMKLSNNGHGEILTKEMGKFIRDEGSWEKGLEVMEQKVVELGVDQETIILRDGSGMSHKNLIPANELTKLLFKVQEKSWFSVYKDALPVAGEPKRFVGGTLRNRMQEEPMKGNVTAKTGSITGVSTLSGYVTALDGEEVIFSIMINNYLGSGSKIRNLEDAIASVLAKHVFK